MHGKQTNKLFSRGGFKTTLSTRDGNTDEVNGEMRKGFRQTISIPLVLAIIEFSNSSSNVLLIISLGLHRFIYGLRNQFLHLVQQHVALQVLGLQIKIALLIFAKLCPILDQVASRLHQSVTTGPQVVALATAPNVFGCFGASTNNDDAAKFGRHRLARAALHHLNQGALYLNMTPNHLLSPRTTQATPFPPQPLKQH